jgi:glutamate synthase domain-containing protein 1
MDTDRRDRSATRRRRPLAAPLYDARYEHDACGVGFVADAGGRSRARVLPLALAGLTALAHRGAFGADGESSDGAGVALPLDRSLLTALAGDPALAAARPAVLMLFLPRGRTAERARALVDRTFSDAGCRAALACADGPAGARARRGLATDGRQAHHPTRSIRRRSPTDGRRVRTTAGGGSSSPGSAVRTAGGPLAELPSVCRAAPSSTRGWSRGRLPDLFPDLRAPLTLGYAVFHQRYATNTHPTWGLAQPFRSIAHNGEINTVRGNREQVRGRAGDVAASEVARALLAAGPLLSADGSDSLSLDEGLVLTTTGWDSPGPRCDP